MPEPLVLFALPEEIERAIDDVLVETYSLGRLDGKGSREEADQKAERADAVFALRVAITAALAQERERCMKAICFYCGLGWKMRKPWLHTSPDGLSEAGCSAMPIRALAAPEQRQRSAAPGEGT